MTLKPKRIRLPTPPQIPRRKDGEIDGRSRRRTGRTVLWSVWVAAEFRALATELAAKEGRAVGAVLDNALREYADKRKHAKRRNHTLG